MRGDMHFVIVYLKSLQHFFRLANNVDNSPVLVAQESFNRIQ